MKLKRFAVGFFILVMLPALFISGQTPNDNLKTFYVGGLKFDYPADWVLTDKSTRSTQHLQLTKPGSLALIAIISPGETIESLEQYSKVQTNISESYIKAIKGNLRPPAKKIAEEYLCLDFNGRHISGMKFTGLFNGEPSAGEIYPFILGKRFLTLIYMRSDRDKALADAAWKQVNTSLSLGNSHKESGLSFNGWDWVEAGLLNEKAAKLHMPEYPTTARMQGVKGAVFVRVVIDETGKVIEAKAEKGNLHLTGAAVQAAKNSKFNPLYFCDNKPVKVTGLIIYNFGN